MENGYHSNVMVRILIGVSLLGIGCLIGNMNRQGRLEKNIVGSIIPVYVGQGVKQTSAQQTEVEHQTGLIKLIAEKSGEALAVTGNGDGTTTTNNFGNIYDATLMEYVVGEQVPITFVDHLPKYGAQQ